MSEQNLEIIKIDNFRQIILELSKAKREEAIASLNSLIHEFAILSNSEREVVMKDLCNYIKINLVPTIDDLMKIINPEENILKELNSSIENTLASLKGIY